MAVDHHVRPPAQRLALVTSVIADVEAPLAVHGQAVAAPSRRTRTLRAWRAPGTAVRLVVFQAIVLAAMLSVVVVALVHEFTTGFQSLSASTLSAELQTYTAAAARAHVDARTVLSFSRHYLDTHPLASGEELVISVPGEGVIESAGSRALLHAPEVARWIVAPPSASTVQTITTSSGAADVIAAPIRVGTETAGTFVASSSLTLLEHQRTRVVWLSVAEAGVALAAAAASLYLVVRRVLRTVGRITTAAEEIGAGSLDRRLGDPGTGDEMAQLSSTFDAMLDRISTVMDAQARLLSDVSHQLRTPMTVARGHLEVLSRTGFADPAAADDTVSLVLDELAHMSAMVDSLLLIGRSVEPDFLHNEPVDLRSFVADLYESATVLAPRHWSMADVPDVVLHVDSAKLRGALLNIVDNAVQATGPDDAIVLWAAMDGERAVVELGVDDTGPGIPAELRQAVLERFNRAPGQTRPGSGLGLAIVDVVARAHGGSVRIGEVRGGGARVVIELPDRLRWDPEEADA